MSTLLPTDEAARLQSLRDCQILDTPPETAFELIANLASRTLDMPIAAVSFMDRDRQWFKSKVGISVCETARDASFCAHAILQRGVLVVPDATADPRFADNPLVTGEPGIRFYAGAPLHGPDGQGVGTLCVLDLQPRAFGEPQRQILADLAALATDELTLRLEIASRQQAETSFRVQHQALKEIKESVERHVATRTLELTEANRTLHREIRQRKLADHERRRSEHRFRQLFNQASDAAFVHDVEGRVVDVNAAACASLGYTWAELLRLGIPDIEMTHDPAEGFQFWRELPVGSVEQFEGRHRRKDGGTFPVEIHVSVLETDEGRHLLALVRDITAHKGTEKLLRTRACEQEAVARLGTRALSGGSVDELLREAVALVADTLEVEICRVHEHLPGPGHFVVRASLDPSQQDVDTVVYPDSPAMFAGYVLHTAQPVVIEDFETETRFAIPGSLRMQGPASAVCVLIGGANPGDARFGVLGAASRHRRTFTEDDVFFVQSVANVLATAIARRRDEDELRAIESRFRLAILHSPFPIMLHADDGEIIKVSDAWTHMTGYLEEELRTMEDWVTRSYPSEPKREEVRGHVADLLNHFGAVEHPGERIRCADGSERVWDFTCANLGRLPDDRWLHITTAVDVTDRLQAETALRAAKDEAERANRAKSVFLSRMSHELRTPLNAILGFGQLLELSPLGTQEALSLQYILKGGRHLLALIDEVLDLSRVETGEMHLMPGDVNVGKLAQECAGLVARLAQARGITCRVTVPGAETIRVDEQRLRQMLLNLLSNAIKYNRDGGDVLVSSEVTPDGQWRLKVADTGPGISPEGMARLFVPFERLEQEFTEAEGTGLGLVISRRIAEAMGGTVGVESEVGRGSTFWIELPVASSLAADPVPAAGLVDPPASCALLPTPNAKLLYIEDNLSNLQVVKALLANCRPRWQFLSARDGKAGLAQAHENLPDLVLLDLQLPGMKGDAVLAELRRNSRTRHIPVVLLSADATALSRERLLADGADDYISKPFKLETLLELLDRTLLKAAVALK